MQEDEQARLTWHVPDGRQLTMRAGLLRILFAGLVTVGFVLILGGGIGSAALAAVAALVVLAGYWFYVHRRDASQAKENVWLDVSGLHWRDASGSEAGLPRDQVEGFRIGLDADTMRALPALTLLLVGGFESQPIELHAPATPQQVRSFLTDQWRIAESQLDDEAFAASLRRAIEAALAGNGRPPLAARLLSCRLVEPRPAPDGTWLVAKLVDTSVGFDRQGCDFRIAASGETIASATLAEVVRYVRDRMLPEDSSELAKLAGEIDVLEQEGDDQQIAADARRAGFYWEGDDSLRFWKLIGSRSRLLSLCDRIDEAAQQLKPPPAGARPAEVRIGGDAFGLSIRVDRRDWIAGDTICGRRESLVDLAQTLREHLTAADEQSSSELEVIFDSAGRWRWRFEVMGEEFDPAELMGQANGVALREGVLREGALREIEGGC